jgi:arylsulfatase A-like enzyme
MKRPLAPALLCVVALENAAGAAPVVAPPAPQPCPAPCPESAPSAPTADVETLRARARDKNVLLVMVDALRASPFADAAGAARRFPNIAALRRRARWFTNAFAPAAGTDLCMGGLLTGNLDPMSGAAVTLPEMLSARGFVTHAVLPREVVRGTSKTLLTRGLDGHDILVTDPRKPNVPLGLHSHRVTNRGLAFLDQWRSRSRPEEPEPFFLWLHYFDVHEHRQLPDDLPAIVARNGGVAASNPAEKYHALLEITDAALGRLFEGIARRGLADDTIVVFAADHGESLREDPRLPASHGLVLYNPLVHVPLAIVAPGLAGGDDPRPASLLDVPVTLLDLQGLRTPRSMNGGQSLLPALASIAPLEDQPRTIVLNESQQFAVIRWPYKLLVRRGTQQTELYDLSRDFAESVNLAPKLPEVAQALTRAHRALPTINLDRTRAGRKRFEARARRTTPGLIELARMAARPRPPAPEPPDAGVAGSATGSGGQ